MMVPELYIHRFGIHDVSQSCIFASFNIRAKNRFEMFIKMGFSTSDNFSRGVVFWNTMCGQKIIQPQYHKLNQVYHYLFEMVD